MSVALRRFAGGVHSNGMLYEFLAACCLVPWLWFTPARRPAIFVLIYTVVVWGQMVVLPNTGATLHHVILIWPFPHFLIAIAAGRASHALGRYGLAALASALVTMTAFNVLLVNQYFADLTTGGTTTIWTDAVQPLFSYLTSLRGYTINTVDWGYASTLCLLSDGDMPLQDISYTLLSPSEVEAHWIGSLIGDPTNVFVDHTDGGTQFPTAHSRLASIALQAGYKKQVIGIISDRNHRPRFEIARYTAASAQ